jgi:hypothetical protein
MWAIKFLCRCIICAVTLVLLNAAFAIAAPTITANPNPVPILLTANSGTTTIQWDAEATHPNAQVWLSVDGGSDTLFDGDYQGVRTSVIQLGKTYIFKLYTGNKSSLLDSVTVTGKKKYPTLQLDILPINFIENIKEDPHGMFAEIKFTTKSSSLPVVMVSEQPPLPFPAASKEDEEVFDEVVSSNFAQTGTVHEAILPDLKPSTEYHYVISAYDKSSGVWYKVKGKFRTLQRSVTVTFQKIKVVDDSDDFGGGDFDFGFFVNGNNAPNGSPLMLFSVDIATGESKNINILASLLNAPETLQLKVIGYDDDEDFPCGAFNVDSSAEGENDCGEWSSDDDSFNIGPNAPDVDNPEGFAKSFTLKAYPKGDDSDVAFDVTGTYSVAYVP